MANITFPPQLGQNFNAPQQAGPPAQGPGASAFEPLIQWAQTASPEEREQKVQMMVARGQPAPPSPLQTHDPQTVVNNATQPDPASGWRQFIDALADPEGSSRFLLEAGTNIMQPRVDPVSGAAHVGSGLTTALDRLGQRRSAAAAGRGTAALQQAQIAGIGQDIKESQAGVESQQKQDTAIPSEITLNLARAYDAMQTANAASRPAAAVQLNNQLRDAIMAIAPDVHDVNTATLLAQQLSKPDMTRSSFLKDFGALMAIMGSPGDVGAMGLQLVDAMGLTDTATLGSIQQEQAAAEQQKQWQAILSKGPDAVFDHVRKRNPTATYEQVQAKVQELTGQQSARVNWEVTGAEAATETEETTSLPNVETESFLNKRPTRKQSPAGTGPSFRRTR